MFEINQFKWNSGTEKPLSLNEIQQDNNQSVVFRRILVASKYTSFDGHKLKGELCYDAYYKEFADDKGLKYTIFCYCYNTKELEKVVENSDLLEFALEVQIETLNGVIGLEAVQWDFANETLAKKNLEYFENKCEEIWKLFGSVYFPT